MATPFPRPTSAFLCNATHEVEAVSPFLKPGRSLWLTSAKRWWQRWHYVAFEPNPPETLEFLLPHPWKATQGKTILSQKRRRWAARRRWDSVEQGQSPHCDLTVTSQFQQTAAPNYHQAYAILVRLAPLSSTETNLFFFATPIPLPPLSLRCVCRGL